MTDVPDNFSWFDRVTVLVKYGPCPSESPSEVWGLLLRPGRDCDGAAILREIQPLPYPGGKPVEYELSTSTRHVEWGATGAAATIFLCIRDYALGPMLGAASTAARNSSPKAVRVRKWYRDEPELQLTRDGMRERARWQVESAHVAPYNGLTPTGHDSALPSNVCSSSIGPMSGSLTANCLGAVHDDHMPDQTSHRKTIKYLNISLEKGTENVPNDGRYYVLHGTDVYYATSSRTLAEAHLELLEDEVKAAHPELKNPRDVLVKEQAFKDVLSVRGEARSRARSQQEAKGGKGGRSGV